MMRIRMQKDRQRCDPNFQIASALPLTTGSMDLIAGLDNRLPRLLFVPWARTSEALADPAAFIAPFAATLEGRILDSLPLLHSMKPLDELPGLIPALGAAIGGEDGLLAQTPAIEVPFAAEAASGAELCARVAELWQAFPDMTRTLGLFGEGYVKHFYHLKEIWHLAKLMGREPSVADFDKFRPAAEAAGADPAVLRAFEESFLAEHASLTNYAQWRAQSTSAVLEFDLDSIADTHECQSPVFLDGRWILDRDTLLHDEERPARDTASDDREPPSSRTAETIS